MTRARDVANVLTAASALATDVETAAAISAHNSTTTSVHGIPNTANLATENFVLNNKGVNKGNTASRPASPTIGDIYYNTELRDLEQYTEDGWLIVAKQPPRIPTIGSASLDGINNASVSFTPSAYGQPATSYIVQSNPGLFTATGSSSPISISGSNLEVGTEYTFRVKSVGSYGQSAYSAYTSTPVIPLSLSDFESIQTVTVGAGGQGSIEFNSIPNTYTHLQIRAFTIGSSNNYFTVRANSDTGSNYVWHQLAGDGTSVTAAAGTSTSIMYSGQGSASSSAGAIAIVDLLDYANTNKFKTFKTLTGYDLNGAGGIWYRSGLWRNTAAINKIDLISGSGNFGEYSHFALYGIKGA